MAVISWASSPQKVPGSTGHEAWVLPVSLASSMGGVHADMTESEMRTQNQIRFFAL